MDAERIDRLAAERDAAVAAADVAEAQTREWRHKYDVLLREHDAATTELAEAVGKVERVRAVHGPWEALRNIKLCRNCGTYLPCATIRALDVDGGDH